MRNSDLPHLLTLEEAADLLNCSKATVRRRVASRKLRAVRHGRVVRIAMEDLDAFLRAGKRWQ